MCCGGNQTSTSSTGLPEAYTNAINYLAPTAVGTAQAGYTGFPGARIAGFAPDEQNAFNQIRSQQGSYMPGLAGAYHLTGLAGRQMPDIDLSAYTNPYQQGVIDIATREARRQDDISRQGRDARAISAGAFGGSRQGLMEAEAERNLSQQLSDIQMTGGLQGYREALAALNADRTAALASGQNFARLGEMQQQLGLRDSAALEQVGRSERDLAQRNLDVGYQNFLEQREWPKTQLAWLAQVLRGQQLPTTTTTTTPGPSAAAQLGGLGLTGISLIGGTGGFGQSGWASQGLSALGKSLFGLKAGGRVGTENRMLTAERERELIDEYEKKRAGDKAYGLEGMTVREILEEKRLKDRRLRELDRGYADGGSVRGGYSGVSNAELIYMREQFRRQGDSRWRDVDSEITRRQSVNAPFSKPRVPAAPPSLPLTERYGLESLMAPGNAAAMPENVEPGGAPLPYVAPAPARVPGPPTPRPQGLEATPFAQENVDMRGGVPNALALVGEDIAPRAPVDSDLEGRRTWPPMAPEAAAPPGFWDKASMPLLVTGLRMMAAKPGETALGAAGAGGLEAVKHMQETRLADIRDRLAKAEEKKVGVTERDVARKEKEDAGTLAYRNRIADIEEKVAAGKMTAYDANAERDRAYAEYLRTAKGEEARQRAEAKAELIDQKREADMTRRDQAASTEYTRLTTKAEEQNLGPLDQNTKFKLDLNFVNRHRGTRYADNMRKSMRQEAEVVADIRRQQVQKKFEKDPKKLADEMKKIDDALSITLKQIGE